MMAAHRDAVTGSVDPVPRRPAATYHAAWACILRMAERVDQRTSTAGPGPAAWPPS
jgi:hypothetical protein